MKNSPNEDDKDKEKRGFEAPYLSSGTLPRRTVDRFPLPACGSIGSQPGLVWRRMAGILDSKNRRSCRLVGCGGTNRRRLSSTPSDPKASPLFGLVEDHFDEFEGV